MICDELCYSQLNYVTELYLRDSNMLMHFIYFLMAVVLVQSIIILALTVKKRGKQDGKNNNDVSVRERPGWFRARARTEPFQSDRNKYI